MSKDLLFDISAIMTYISEICLSTEKLYSELSNYSNHIQKLILDEYQNPVYTKLDELVKNNNIFITKMAKNKTEELITSLGTNNEKNNLKKFFEKAQLIDDDPDKIFNEFKGKIWSIYNKNIFGTAYKFNYTIVTGNIDILNDLINGKEIKIDYVAHRSRCFLGHKNIKN